VDLSVWLVRVSGKKKRTAGNEEPSHNTAVLAWDFDQDKNYDKI
jgi:hypothetical protein